MTSGMATAAEVPTEELLELGLHGRVREGYAQILEKTHEDG